LFFLPDLTDVIYLLRVLRDEGLIEFLQCLWEEGFLFEYKLPEFGLKVVLVDSEAMHEGLVLRGGVVGGGAGVGGAVRGESVWCKSAEGRRLGS
jgi:hypothetical protein